MCENHFILCKDFKWLQNYINNLDCYNEITIYVLNSSISERKSMIINEVDIVNGKMDIEGYLKQDTCSPYMERILKEILLLEKAKKIVSNQINNVKC